MPIDHIKVFGSHLLIWSMLTNFLKHGRMKVLHFGIVKDAREIFIESITIGFVPERFAICIASDRE